MIIYNIIPLAIAPLIHNICKSTGILHTRFSLGYKSGTAINIAALAFLTVFWIFQFVPTAPSPRAAEMNWSCVVWVAILGGLWVIIGGGGGGGIGCRGGKGGVMFDGGEGEVWRAEGGC